MNKINTYNYEAWLLDYTEGNLTNEQEKEVDQFLDKNPELKAEFDQFEPFYLQPDTSITFDKKDELLKEEKKGGRTVYFNFGIGIAAAAAVIIAMIAILPFFWNNSSQPSTMTALNETPLWNGIEASAREQEMPAENQQQLAVDNTVETADENGTQADDKERNIQKNVIPQRESTRGLAALEHETISEIQDYDDQYYYGQSDVFANVDRTPKELNYVFPDSQPVQQRSNLITSILNTEVARAFIPEAIEEEMPATTPREDRPGPTIYLELPPAGKKIVDKILN